MSTLKDQIEQDNSLIFLNLKEFAEVHKIQGKDCLCVIQNGEVVQTLSIGGGQSNEYPGIYGVDLTVFLQKNDLSEIPSYGQLFTVDDDSYLVDNVKDDMGILTIGLVANDR